MIDRKQVLTKKLEAMIDHSAQGFNIDRVKYLERWCTENGYREAEVAEVIRNIHNVNTFRKPELKIQGYAHGS